MVASVGTAIAHTEIMATDCDWHFRNSAMLPADCQCLRLMFAIATHMSRRLVGMRMMANYGMFTSGCALRGSVVILRNTSTEGWTRVGDLLEVQIRNMSAGVRAAARAH